MIPKPTTAVVATVVRMTRGTTGMNVRCGLTMNVITSAIGVIQATSPAQRRHQGRCGSTFAGSVEPVVDADRAAHARGEDVLVQAGQKGGALR